MTANKSRSAPAPDHQHAEEEDDEEHQWLGRAQRRLPTDIVDDEESDPEDRGADHRGTQRHPERAEDPHSASTGSWLAGGRAPRSGGRKVKTNSAAAPSPLTSTLTVPPPFDSLPNSTSSASGFFRCAWMTRASGRAPNMRS